jgi:mono/diheme cytochrome c family protein
MNLWVVVPVLAVMAFLRLLKVGQLTWVLAWWGALYVGIRYGMAAPAPQSVITMYMAIATLALAAYVWSSHERTEAVLGPVTRLMSEKRYTPLLVAIALIIPALAGYNAYRAAGLRQEPPYFGRTVHPAPPPQITVGETEVDLIRSVNPYRELEESDPEAFQEHVRAGREVYYRNCFYCHGDALGGDGMFAHGLDPLPTDFTDAGVLPNFQESFFFWRVAKGGPGMPEEGGPWDSAMPRWEQFLSEDEMWDVLVFLYEFTDRSPREVGEFVNE